MKGMSRVGKVDTLGKKHWKNPHLNIMLNSSIQSSIYPSINLSIHPTVYLSIHPSSICPSIHSPIHLVTHSFIFFHPSSFHSTNQLAILSVTHPVIQKEVYIQYFTCSSFGPSIHPSNYSEVSWFIYSFIYSPIHLFIHPFNLFTSFSNIHSHNIYSLYIIIITLSLSFSTRKDKEGVSEAVRGKIFQTIPSVNVQMCFI